jgi:hypothetical protein
MVWTIETDEIIREIEKGSDRSAAIVLAAVLEERLGQLLLTIFEKEESITGRMLKGSGPLAAFSTKIDICFLMGVYAEYMRRALHTMKDVRNIFAHSPVKTTFKTQRVRDLCNNLPAPVWKSQIQSLKAKDVDELVNKADVPSDQVNDILTRNIYVGRDTPRNRYLITGKSALIHIGLVTKVAEQRRQIMKLDSKTDFWAWPRTLHDKSLRKAGSEPLERALKKPDVRPRRAK